MVSLSANSQKIFEEEKEKLGLDNIEISIKILKPSFINRDGSFRGLLRETYSEASKIIRFDDGTYELQINSRDLFSPSAFRKTCKHELFHASQRHGINFHDPISVLRYLFFDEPRAIAYEYGLLSR